MLDPWKMFRSRSVRWAVKAMMDGTWTSPTAAVVSRGECNTC
jgi:hypothetical protein